MARAAALLCALALALSALSAAAAAAAAARYRPVPGAGYMREDCIHALPSGAHVRRDADGATVVVERDGASYRAPQCAPRADAPVSLTPQQYRQRRARDAAAADGASAPPSNDYDGWLTYTAFPYSVSFDSFLGYFSVPDEPKAVPEMLYVFIGLQNIDWIPVVDPEPSGDFDIIQPVLQYPGDWGHYWSVKSWYVTLKSGAYHSHEEKVAVGDTIFGNMTRTGPLSWYIGSTIASTSTTVEIKITNQRLQSQPWAYNTLECYGCSGCGTFPTQPIQFTQLELYAGEQLVTPAWKVDPKPSHNKQCHEQSTVVSPQQVTVSFQ